jgi:hypothetical protein
MGKNKVKARCGQVDQQWKWEKSKDGVGLWLVKLALCAELAGYASCMEYSGELLVLGP